jgi:hypothetical protein
MRPLLFVLLASAVLALSAGPAEAKRGKLTPVSGPLQAAVGIADQKASIFDDPRFGRLGHQAGPPLDRLGHHALRLAGRRRRRLDAGRPPRRRHAADHLRALADRLAAPPAPTAEQIRRAFVAFRKRYPWARDFVASNESNHYGEPTGRRPEARRAVLQGDAPVLPDVPDRRRHAGSTTPTSSRGRRPSSRRPGRLRGTGPCTTTSRPTAST